MTTQSKPASEITSRLHPCTTEEEEEMQRLDWESDQNVAHRDAKLARLIKKHRGQFALFYCDDQGEAQVVIAEELSQLYSDIHIDCLQAAVVELLDNDVELSVPYSLIDLD